MTSIQQRARDLIALAEKATPGPWVNPDGYGVRGLDREVWMPVCLVWKCEGKSVERGVDDMEFIAAARNAAPDIAAAFLRAVELLRKCNGVTDPFSADKLAREAEEFLKEIEK